MHFQPSYILLPLLGLVPSTLASPAPVEADLAPRTTPPPTPDIKFHVLDCHLSGLNHAKFHIQSKATKNPKRRFEEVLCEGDLSGTCGENGSIEWHLSENPTAGYKLLQISHTWTEVVGDTTFKYSDGGSKKIRDFTLPDGFFVKVKANIISATS